MLININQVFRNNIQKMIYLTYPVLIIFIDKYYIRQNTVNILTKNVYKQMQMSNNLIINRKSMRTTRQQ